VVWCLIILFSLIIPASAQQSPAALKSSLRLHAQTTNTDSIGHYLAVLGDYYLSVQKFDSANHYYQKALQHNRLIGDNGKAGENLNNLGVLYHHLGSLDSSIYYYDAAYQVYRVLKDTTMMSILETNLGILYKNKGLYEKSLAYLLGASQKLEKSPPSEHLASCYNSIGNVYLKINQPEEALAFHYKSLAVRRKLGSKNGISSSLNNIGNVYLLLNDYDSALTNFQRSLTIKRELNNISGQGISLNNIGELMLKTGKLDEAEKLFKEALAIRLETKEKVGQVITRNNLAHGYLLKGELSRAEGELKRSENLASASGFLEPLKTNYEIQIKLYRRMKDLDQALTYSERLLVIKDSLLNQEKAQSLAEMQTRYESLKKEDRIALLEKEGLLHTVEMERRKIWIRSLVLAMVLTLIIGVLIYYNLRTVRKNKIHIELLLKELHHRVKNNLQIISSLLSLQSQQLTDDTAIKAVKSSESRINAMALIHRKLYTVDQNRTVDIKEYITELIQYLVYSYGYHEKNLKLDLDINEFSIDVDKAIPLGLILNELISNAFKHAYENQPNPRLMINLGHPGTHELNIRICDNGSGMPVADVQQKKTFGMKIVTTLIKELKGSLDVKSANGTTYDLHIPI
jgi:two-component sensor histidine kinase/Tfp pilus assembly protein PilF